MGLPKRNQARILMRSNNSAKKRQPVQKEKKKISGKGEKPVQTTRFKLGVGDN